MTLFTKKTCGYYNMKLNMNFRLDHNNSVYAAAR